MAVDLRSSASRPASILVDYPARSCSSSKRTNWLPPPSLPNWFSGIFTCQNTFQTRATCLSSKVPSSLNTRNTFSIVPRSTGSSSSEQSTEDSKSSTDQEKVPFGYTRKDVLLIGLGVTLVGIGLKYGLEFIGVDSLKAGNVVQLVLVLGLTVGWISTYIFRVSNKDMTYAQQLKDYENKVMQVCVGPAMLELVGSSGLEVDEMSLHFDGGFLRSSSRDSGGFLLRDCRGAFVLAGWTSFAANSAFGAEMRACWEAVRLIVEAKRPTKIRIVGESMRVIQELGAPIVSSDMIQDCRFILSTLAGWRVTHISRELNGAAHALAACAFRVGGSRIFHHPPAFLSLWLGEGDGG